MAINSQGTVIAVSSGSGTSITITAITKATQAVVTGNNTLQAGDSVTITGVTGMTQINGDWTVVSATATTFTLAVDSTNFTTYASGGTAKPYTFVTGCSITTVSGFDGSAAEIDTTTLCSLAKTFALGLQDFGSAKFDGFFAKDTDDLFQAELRKAKAAATPRRFRITLPLGQGFFVFTAYVKTNPLDLGVDQVIKTSFDLRISGVVDII